MRTTDLALLVLLCLAILGAMDPAGASDLLGHLHDHLAMTWSSWGM